MDRYEMVEKGNQHHNASLKPQTAKQNKTKNTKILQHQLCGQRNNS